MKMMPDRRHLTVHDIPRFSPSQTGGGALKMQAAEVDFSHFSVKLNYSFQGFSAAGQ